MADGMRDQRAAPRGFLPLQPVRDAEKTHRARIELPALGRRVVLQQEALLRRAVPERLGERRRLHAPRSRMSALLFAQLRAYCTPPVPVTSALDESFTWRAPASPKSCCTASTRFTPPPARPGCPAETWPPPGLIGRFPLYPILFSRMNRPASPG